MESVVTQSCKEFEYIVIDGASTGGSVEIIKHYAAQFPINWVSEPDKGIYNAMNKGIDKAQGEYINFLNSGDALYDRDVVERMLRYVETHDHPALLLGQTHVKRSNGTIEKAPMNSDFTLLRFYVDSIFHQSTYIRRDLFDKYGAYDERYRIVSDWKWFLQVIPMADVQPVIVDVNVSIFDTTGISETNTELNNKERCQVVEEVVPRGILENYDRYANYIFMIQHLRSHKWAYKLVRYVDRLLYLLEKRK
ncbi:MAG: glycosyltransferase [Bacteroidales bacterium]|nr:glycosyltransferase [Bacteroidales bacterium]